MERFAYYAYDDCPEIVISEEQAVWLSLLGYTPHADRHNGTDDIYYPIPEEDIEFWQSLSEDAA